MARLYNVSTVLLYRSSGYHKKVVSFIVELYRSDLINLRRIATVDRL
jgi:hypothetical protein